LRNGRYGMEKINALSVKECAAYLGIIPNYVYRLIYLKRLPCHKPFNGKLYFLKDEIYKVVFSKTSRKGCK
jgi:excisionase family DNA binding protein